MIVKIVSWSLFLFGLYVLFWWPKSDTWAVLSFYLLIALALIADKVLEWLPSKEDQS